MPTTDSTCSVARGPNGNSFGFDCTGNPIGSLYYRGLGIKKPNTAVPMPMNTVGPFRNFSAVPLLVGERKGAQAQRPCRDAQPRGGALGKQARESVVQVPRVQR